VLLCKIAHRRCSGNHKRCLEPASAVLDPQAL
jgi:hypothetical protein